ncbi:hypothetical protein [Streptomyces violaceusniger]|uniref:hypothetical protein n=1 Tax=Streptomyces violaceusniger TaxID=68280 RepID=UPI003673A5C3
MTEPDQPEPIRRSDLTPIPPPESEIFTWFPHPDGGGDMVRGQRQRGVQVRRRVSYGDWEPVRPGRWADEPEKPEAGTATATQPPLPALLARLIAEGRHHAYAAAHSKTEELARVHEGAVSEAYNAAVYVADLIATGRMRHPGYDVAADDAIQARRVADDLSRHPATRSDAISAAIYGGATDTSSRSRESGATSSDAVPERPFAPPPPGSTEEQLPDDVLALIDPPPYLSTACGTAQLLEQAVVEHPDRQAGLGEWARRMHSRCRINNKYIGRLCTCGHHSGA